VRGEAALAAHDPGGIEPLTMTLAQFKEALVAEKHTLKRTLTDPRTYSGIGNAYSDEILHRARLSPVRMSTALEDDEVARLYRAIQDVLVEWTDRLRADDADQPLPAKVTAFRKEMAVHGKAGQPCPVCGAPVQRIAYADNETNYCAPCQTGGKLLADRALSTLMKKDWPKTLDELEALKKAHRAT
jgi:formamidopyrimidine-DNA glycosylase